MLNFSKGVLAVVLGAGGIGGTAYGAFSSPRGGIRTLDIKDPVLVCDDGTYEKYEVFLTLAEEGEKNLGEGVTFRIYKTWKFKGKSEKRKMVWGEKAKGNNNWRHWKLTFSNSDGTVDGIFTKEGGERDYHSDQSIQGCPKPKGESKIRGKGEIESEKIKFVLANETCTYGSGFKECEIKFDTSTNLRWEDGFKPKMRFSYSN